MAFLAQKFKPFFYREKDVNYKPRRKLSGFAYCNVGIFISYSLLKIFNFDEAKVGKILNYLLYYDILHIF